MSQESCEPLLPEGLQVNLGEGRIAIEPCEDSQGGQGLTLRDTGHPHRVGAPTHSARGQERSLEPGEIYVRCADRASALILMEQMCRVVAGFTKDEIAQGNIHSEIDNWKKQARQSREQVAELRKENERLEAKVSSLIRRLADRYGAETCKNQELLAEVKQLRHDKRVLMDCRRGIQACHECPDTECHDNMRDGTIKESRS